MSGAKPGFGFSGSQGDAYEQIFELARESWSKFAEVCDFPSRGAGIRLLDVGAGPGEPSCHLKHTFPDADITCTDLEAGMVEKAKKRAERLGVQLDFQVCAAHDLSLFADESFDVVTANMVLMFVTDRCLMIKESMRVLKPGGRFILTVWKRSGMHESVREVMNSRLGMDIPEPCAASAHPIALREEGAVEAIVADAGHQIDSADHYKIAFHFDNDEHRIKSNLLFVARRNLQAIAEQDREKTEREYVQGMLEEAAKRGWKQADGSLKFPGEHQIVVILKQPVH